MIGPARYASWRSTRLGGITERLEHDLLLGLAGPLTECRVLDIGCGDGALTGRLVAGGAVVTAIDSDPKMVAEAALAAPTATVMVAEAERLPFAGGSFDVVVANTVFCLVVDRRTALAEAVRVLRPGGRLVLGELGRWSLWAAKRRVQGMLGSRLWRDSQFSDARSLTTELAVAGLTVGVVRGAVFYPPVGWAARLMARVDSCLGRYTTIGAAYLAVAATKPDPSGMDHDDH
ncbi:MAG: methyltransferase domain-containing protein [Magnetospirillum gryphiswaldense]|nr:methyltransferase domain-containing protein [Magnetospirillum gryphiswaldense]